MTAAIVVCRLCLNDSDSYLDIYSDNSQHDELDKKILRYLGVQIKEDDPHSKFVCSKCIDRLEEFHIFSSEVVANQERLQVSNSDSPVISNEKGPIVQLNEYVITLQSSGQNDTVTFDLNQCLPVIDVHQPSTPIPDLSMSVANDVPQVDSKAIDIMIEDNVDLNDSIEEKPQIKQENVEIEIDLERKSKRTSLARFAKRVKQKVKSGFQKKIKRDANQTKDEVGDDNNDVYDSDGTDDLNENDEDERCSDPSDSDVFADHEEFAGFPKVMIQHSKLIFGGKKLLDLMSRFYRLECDMCTENKTIYSRISTLCQHYNEVHSIKGYVICCGLRLIKPDAMAMHMARHLQPDAFQCPTCDKLLTCPKALQYHIQNHLPEEKRPLACPVCPRKFTYSSALDAHLISHQPEKERAAHICDECGKSFSNAGNLSSHKNVHVNHTNDYICHICAKKLACPRNLAYHLTTHQPKIHQVQCEECGKFFKNKLCLGKHMIQHSMVRFTCELCDYSAVNKQCLTHHVKVQHSDIKPFSCQFCGKTFKLRSTLLNHLVKHNGIRKFSCEFCGHAFAASGNYYSHRKRMHPQELAALIEQKEEKERQLREGVFETP